jgi:RHS repeat-associated protein
MVYLEGMPLSAIDAAASPKQIYAVHADHLNRPVMLTNAAKATVWSAIYEPFGRVHSVTGTVTQNLGLPGQWFQLEHGLAYNWHRHYDPTTGRYTTADPLGFVDGPSVFAYVGNAPHIGVDPSGQFGIGGAVGSMLWSVGTQYFHNRLVRGLPPARAIWCVDYLDVVVSGIFGSIAPGWLFGVPGARGKPWFWPYLGYQTALTLVAGKVNQMTPPIGLDLSPTLPGPTVTQLVPIL